MSTETYRSALADAMSKAMREHDNTIIIGQGVTDFKGLFGTTSGLNELYPDRVIETPIAEDSIAGICIGLALNGMYPINTNIRADFGLLIFNQLINLAAKYRYMFGGLFEVPAMFRMIIGRSWGQGAQHSQSLQSLLAHIPGLTVVMPSSPAAIAATYDYAVSSHRGPVVMLEHRLMYELSFESSEDTFDCHPFSSRIIREGKDVTIVATSIMTLEALRASQVLKKMDIDVEVIDLHCVSHPDMDMIFDSVKKTGNLIVADTSWTAFGVCAEINRVICERDPRALKKPSISIGMAPSPCPTAKALEDVFYPSLYEIVTNACELLDDKNEVKSLIPEKQSMTDFYKHFRGPF